jgi:hypothetical protein
MSSSAILGGDKEQMPHLPNRRRRHQMRRFMSKVVVITDGSSGIGLAAAQDSSVKASSKDAITVNADVTKAADLDRLFAARISTIESPATFSRYALDIKCRVQPAA